MTDPRIEDVLGFLTDHIRDQVGEGTPIDANTNFVDSGLLDSFATLSMIMDLESRFSVKFRPQELADPALRTLGTLAEAVLGKIQDS